MIGAVVIVVVLVVLPLLFWVGSGVIAVVMGQALVHHAEETHDGSELIATNR